jgi:cell division protein ZapE
VPRVLHLSELELPSGPALEGLIPPPRFGLTTFEGYQPQDPSQERARDEVREFALLRPRREAAGFRWPWRRPPEAPGQGLYLDGGFGVGKTHLLAAAYHEAEGPKAYLSFQELVYLIGVLGGVRAKEALGHYSLLCIDEFELDDPGNTLIVKQFLAHALAGGGRVLTTSNTPPERQGQGRFNAHDFRREIQSIARHFRTLTLAGGDYRRRRHQAGLMSEAALETLLASEPAPGPHTGPHTGPYRGPKVYGDWPALTTLLAALHPVRYRGLLKGVGTLYLSSLTPLEDQNSALRFVHFIDKLYDLKLGFRASGRIALEDIFHPSYRSGAFSKKYYRCVSRLAELLGEAQPAPVSSASA